MTNNVCKSSGTSVARWFRIKIQSVIPYLDAICVSKRVLIRQRRTGTCMMATGSNESTLRNHLTWITWGRT